jgi:Xaa-Pro aminopeptidase
MPRAAVRYEIGCLAVFFALAAGGCADGPGSEPAEASSPKRAGPTGAFKVPGAQDRFKIRKEIITKRLNTVLLPAMRAHNIDLWLVFSREHNEDPMLSELGGGWGGVRNAYLFFNLGDRVEKVFIGSHELRDTTIPDAYNTVIYYGYSKEGIKERLARIVSERDPKRIGVNASPTLPMADGLSWTLRQFLEEALGPQYAKRMVSAELLARDFRTNHIPEEVRVFQDLCRWTVAWEEEALSDRVVTIGKTTADDIHWWMRERALEMGLDVEFLPGVRITRQGRNLPTNSPDDPVQPGDLISIDAGLAYIDYRTDIKRTAYVLRPGEGQPPASIHKAFADALKVTDRLLAHMKPGLLGHEVWQNTMDEMKARGYAQGLPAAGGVPPLDPRQPEVGIYSHSVGNSTHDIGARIAVDWPFAYGDRVRYPLATNAWYSVELHVSTPIPEWGGLVLPIRIEEDAALTDSGVVFFAPRQSSLLLIGRQAGS